MTLCRAVAIHIMEAILSPSIEDELLSLVMARCRGTFEQTPRLARADAKISGMCTIL